MSISIQNAASEADIRNILLLQQQNLAKNLTEEQIKSQGFVTLVHDFDLLNRMNQNMPHIIAKENEQLVGYALAMSKEFRAEVPLLESMFEKIETLSIDGKAMIQMNYFVMGQICIAETHRGLGIFDKLYEGLYEQFHTQFDWCLTEISLRNTRSMRAHKRIGFKTLFEHQDETDHWALVGWQWN